MRLLEAEPFVLPYLSARRWLVAYSGGLDSSALLHYLTHIPQRPEIVAIHVHHGLQMQADDWLQYCQQQAQQLGVAFVSFRVAITGQDNLEEKAREARYQAFQQVMQPDDVLFMAHHADDQLETMLYRLARGAGLRGLTAIPKQRDFANGQIVRPFLSIPRATLQQYAELHQLSYVVDPSNEQANYDRNFLRLDVIPQLKQRWPVLLQNTNQAITHLTEAQSLLDELAEQDLAQLTEQRWGYPCLLIEPWQLLSLARQKNSLRFWLYQQGIVLSAQQLQTLMRQVVDAKPDAMPELQLSGKVIRRFQQALYICPLERAPVFTTVRWQLPESCKLSFWGEFSVSKNTSIELLIKPRLGGERIRLWHHSANRQLKSVLQELSVPPWLRERIPLIYYQDELLAVADLLLTQRGIELLGGLSIQGRSLKH